MALQWKQTPGLLAGSHKISPGHSPWHHPPWRLKGSVVSPWSLRHGENIWKYPPDVSFNILHSTNSGHSECSECSCCVDTTRCITSRGTASGSYSHPGGFQTWEIMGNPRTKWRLKTLKNGKSWLSLRKHGKFREKSHRCEVYSWANHRTK